MELGAEFDAIEVDRALADVEERGKRLRPAFRQLRKPMRGDQRQHARDERGPDAAWPPRSPLTEARRRARNRRLRTTKAMRTIGLGKFTRTRATPKQILGRLPSALIVTAGELFVRATSRVPWSGIHQFGGRANHGARIPARPFLWLSDDLVETARQVLVDFVIKGWKR